MIADINQIPTLDRKPHRFQLTPEHFVGALIIIEILYWLVEDSRWSAVNEKKGLPVFGVLTVLFAVLLGFAVRYLIALIFRQRFQFGLRMLLLLMLATAIPCSWLACCIDRAKREHEVALHLQNERNCQIETETGLVPPQWLTHLLGENYFTNVHFICHQNSDFSDNDLRLCRDFDNLEICLLNRTSVTDAGLEYIENLANLKHLELSDTPITDAGLKHLAKLTCLETLNLTGTNVTEAGVQRLQSQLPRCKVTW
jgi:hypothetical protein